MRPATLDLSLRDNTPNLRLDAGRAAHARTRIGLPPWQVRAFVFETSNVLYDDTAWRRWLFRVLTSLGLHTNYMSFFRVWDDEYLPAVNRGEHELGEAFRRFLTAVGLKPAQIQEIEIAAHPRRTALESSVRLLPGVLPTLERMHAAGIQLAVLGDCQLSGEQLRAKLTRLGLGHVISHCRTSLDLAATKPSRVCYDAILADLAVVEHDVAFVGHRHDSLSGAAARGLRTIAFNWEADAEAQWYLTKFADLLAPRHVQRQAA